mmetsp:Transcript_42811/g.96685  ORF Transcript_42811/g.96685 Transcript_42811/m.96685 type:complete len:206 (-) Transcript_42811:226-843(-)
MGNAVGECTPHLATSSKAPDCSPAAECCTPHLCGRNVDALDDRECADILLVNGTQRGDLPDVKRALAMGASPNTPAGLSLRMGEPTGGRKKQQLMTPLMRACWLGHEDIMMTLLEARASPCQCDSHGWSALCHALGAGELQLARQLAEQLDPAKLQSQKDTIHKLRSEVVMKCEKDVGKDVADFVRRELDPPGFFAPAAGPAPGG